MQHFTDFLLILHVQLEIVGVNAEAEKIARAAQKVFIGVYRIPVGRGSAPEKAAGNAGSTGSAGKAGRAGSRRQANGAEGSPLRRAVFRYMSCLPCCRRTGTALPASSPGGGNCGERGKPGTAGRWETREAGDKKAAQGKASAPCRIQIYVLPALLPPDRNRLARKLAGRARPRRYRRAAPRRLPKVSAPSPQRLSSASASHSAGSLPSPVSGTGSGSAVTRSVNTGLLVVPNVFVASQ